MDENEILRQYIQAIMSMLQGGGDPNTAMGMMQMNPTMLGVGAGRRGTDPANVGQMAPTPEIAAAKAALSILGPRGAQGAPPAPPAGAAPPPGGPPTDGRQGPLPGGFRSASSSPALPPELSGSQEIGRVGAPGGLPPGLIPPPLPSNASGPLAQGQQRTSGPSTGYVPQYRDVMAEQSGDKNMAEAYRNMGIDPSQNNLAGRSIDRYGDLMQASAMMNRATTGNKAHPMDQSARFINAYRQPGGYSDLQAMYDELAGGMTNPNELQSNLIFGSEQEGGMGQENYMNALEAGMRASGELPGIARSQHHLASAALSNAERQMLLGTGQPGGMSGELTREEKLAILRKYFSVARP